MVLVFDDDDPKRPRPVLVERKREGWLERGEARKDDERERHRLVQLRC